MVEIILIIVLSILLLASLLIIYGYREDIKNFKYNMQLLDFKIVEYLQHIEVINKMNLYTMDENIISLLKHSQELATILRNTRSDLHDEDFDMFQLLEDLEEEDGDQKEKK